MAMARRKREQPIPAVEDLKTCGHLLSERRLVWGRSGNISAKVEADAFLISASGSDLGALRSDDLVLCQIHADTCQGAKSPSIEKGMHQAIYKAVAEAAAVIHSQPFYATLVACSDITIKTDLFPEAMAYLDRIERVPYRHAGSPDLAKAAAAKACSSHALLLDNHGAVCWGYSIDEALLRTETLEFLRRLVVMSNISGNALNHLGRDTMVSFLEHLQLIKRA